jgi:hypothetical protein
VNVGKLILHEQTIIILMSFVLEIRNITARRPQSLRYILSSFATANSVDIVE